MTLLVTGGAGFIGANFVLDWLAESSETVVNLDKLTYAGNLETLASLQGNPAHVFVQGDIGDADLVSRLLQTHQPRAVINVAAESHVDRSIHGPGEFIETNVMGTFRLLESVRGYWQALDAPAQADFRFLHVSTDEVYGSLTQDAPAFSESHRYEPNSPYSASKAASDHLVRAWHHTYGLPVLTTNCSNNYGPFHFPEKLIPVVILNALQGKPIPVYGDGSNVRDWLYVEDHAEALLLALEKGENGRSYNIGGGNEAKNIDLVRIVCAALDRAKPKNRPYADQITFVGDRPGHDHRYAIDATRIRTELGWEPKVRLEEGIARTVKWYLENEAWWRPLLERKGVGERLGHGTADATV